MHRFFRHSWTHYLLAVLTVSAAGTVRWMLDPVLEVHLPYSVFFVAIILTGWFGGWRPALLAAVLGFLIAWYSFLPPRFSLIGASGQYLAGVALYFTICLMIIGILEALRSSQRALFRQEELLRTTLKSIGDAVITTDGSQRITFLNPMAETLTGWTNAEADGRDFREVLKIINEQTRKTEENPVARVLKTKQVSGLANHSVLIRKDGSERPVDDSASPILDAQGAVLGAVLVLRDITERRQAEKSLRASEQRFRLAAEAISGIIYEYDFATGKMERTQGLFTVLGFRPEEVPATIDWWLEQTHPEDRRFLDARIHFHKQGSESCPPEPLSYRVMHKDGRCLHVSDRCIIVTDDNGNPVRQVGCITDVTAQVDAEQELRNSERREQERAAELETVLHATPIPVWIAHDPACERITGNPASFRLLDIPEKENVPAIAVGVTEHGHGFHVYRNGVEVPWEELPMPVSARQGVNVDGVELTLAFPDGRERTIYGNAAPLRAPNGSVRGSIAAFIDISEIKEAEKKLREADRRKDEFLATLAHELRNPLAPISNAVQLLKASTPPDSIHAWSIDIVSRQVQTMARLLDDLLDVSRISRNKLVLRKERIDVAAVIEQAVETSRPQIEMGGHELIVDLPSETISLDADPIRLAQIFSNLLNNAAKYTDTGGHIRLEAAREDGMLRISVKDDGIGISADMLPRLFEIFSQAEPARRRSQGGLGIGLSLVRGLVELHGGSIEAHSEGPGRGSEFVVRLPCLPSQEVTPTTPVLGPGELTLHDHAASCKVLVADDNRDSADTMTQMLQAMGHEVHTAYDGREAIVMAQRTRPDVILLDIGMPYLDGYEVCRRIRKQSWGKSVVMIATTGWGQENDRQLAEQAGFDRHLVKPVDPKLIASIMAAVQVEGHP